MSFIFSLAFITFAEVTALTLPCVYKVVNWKFDNKKQKGYKCEIAGKFEVKERNMTIDKIKRDDPEGYPQPMNYTNPSHIWALNKDIWYFPKHLEIFFAHLRILEFQNCGLRELTQNDLKAFPELASLNLDRNLLQILEKDLFKFNPKLQGITINTNFIKYIDANIIDHLNDLTVINLLENDCLTAMGGDRAEIKKNIKSQIKNNCQKFGDIEQAKSIAKTGTKRGKYFWILIGCGVIAAIFVIAAVARIIYGIIKSA